MKKITLSVLIILFSFSFANEISINNRDECSDFSQDECETIDYCQWNSEEAECERYDDDNENDGGWESECAELSQDECFENPECDWSVQVTPFGTFEVCLDTNWNDDGGWEDGGWESECAELSQDECFENPECDWSVQVTPFGTFEVCLDTNWNDDGGWEDGGWESDCNGLNYEDCEYLDFCMWLTDSDDPSGSSGSCVDISDWNDDGGWEDGGWESDCNGLNYEDCEYLDFCMWLTDSDNPSGSSGSCVDISDWNDDGGWEDCDPDLACATVLTCIDGLLYPTACGPENCDEPISECDEEINQCEGLGYQVCQMMEDCEWLSDNSNPNSNGYCVEAAGSNPCSDFGQEDCEWFDECIWTDYGCQDYDWNDDSGDDGGWDNECSELTQDECTESEFCDWSVIIDPNGVFEMCVESGDSNDDGGWDDWECSDLGYQDCEFYDFCEWVPQPDMIDAGYCIDVTDNDEGPPECVLDCEGIENVSPEDDGTYFCEWLLYIFPTGCAEDCDQDTLDFIEEAMNICEECLADNTCDDAWQDNCSGLDYEECVDTQDCEPNYNSAGQFEGCVESDDQTGGCWEDGEFYCIGCEYFINECDYYECTLNGFVGPFTLDECGEGGDDGNDDGGEFQTILKIGDVASLPGELIEVPLYYASPVPLAGIQFTIVDSPDWVTGIELVSNTVNDCFETNSNDINGGLIGIMFSLEQCVLPISDEGTHFATILYEMNSEITWGDAIELYFEEAIVSNPQGESVPVEGIGGSILFSLLGDNTSDGAINVLDVVSLINFILFFEDPNEYEFWASDVNIDGSLNVLDVVLLVDLILNNTP